MLSSVAESKNQNTPPLSPTESAPSDPSTILESKRSASSSPVKEKSSPRASPVKQIESPAKEVVNDTLSNKQSVSEPSDSKNVLEDQVETPQEEISQSVNAVQQKPPLPDRKPPIAEKPLVFPKPVLLQKPDKPMQFGMLCCTIFSLKALLLFQFFFVPFICILLILFFHLDSFPV
jgi:hypothetical protein